MCVYIYTRVYACIICIRHAFSNKIWLEGEKLANLKPIRKRNGQPCCFEDTKYLHSVIQAGLTDFLNTKSCCSFSSVSGFPHQKHNFWFI